MPVRGREQHTANYECTVELSDTRPGMMMCFGSIAEALRLSIANKPALKMSDVPRSHRDGHRHRNHASYFADRQAIEVVATEHVEDYRAAADALQRSNDVAIEVGCAGGKTTAVLGCRCAGGVRSRQILLAQYAVGAAAARTRGGRGESTLSNWTRRIFVPLCTFRSVPHRRRVSDSQL